MCRAVPILLLTAMLLSIPTTSFGQSNVFTDIFKRVVGKDPDNEQLRGEFALLDVQEDHLKFIEELRQQASSYEDAIELCRAYMIENESIHMQLSRTENHLHGIHSTQWWNTLHKMEYYSDFLENMKDWNANYTKVL